MKPELNHNATGVKRPFKLEEIWRIRTRIEIQNNLMTWSTKIDQPS